MARRSSPPLALTACGIVVSLLWLLSGHVSGFLVGAPRISRPRAEHAAQHCVNCDKTPGGGGAAAATATAVLPRRTRCNAVVAVPAAAKDMASEEEVGVIICRSAVYIAWLNSQGTAALLLYVFDPLCISSKTRHQHVQRQITYFQSVQQYEQQ